jgi:hypothetical protein
MNMYAKAALAIDKITDEPTRNRAKMALAHHKNHHQFMYRGLRPSFGAVPTRPKCARLAQRRTHG